MTDPHMAARVDRSAHGRLAAQAAAAAGLRALLSDPDVVALRVEKIRGQVDTLLATAIYLGLAFTMSNVQAFAARGAPAGSTAWWAAWLLDPIPSLALLAILRAEKITARYQLTLPVWARRTKWLAFTATYVMNTWTSWGLGDQPLSWSGIVAHSVPPLVVLFAAEAGPGIRDTLTEAVHRATVAAHHGALHRQQPPGISHADLNGDSPATREGCSCSAPDGIGLDSHGSTAGSLPPNSSGVIDDEGHTLHDGVAVAVDRDPRVHEVAHRLRTGEEHTGESIAALFGVSPRTGRRILRTAETTSRPPPVR